MKKKVQVTERAVFARMSRALSKGGSILKRCSPHSRSFQTLGRYYIVLEQTGYVHNYGFSLEEMAREAGVLKEWEEMIEG